MQDSSDQKYHPDEIRVGFEFNPVSVRLLHRRKFIKPEYINQIFDCEIDFLIEKSTRHVFLPAKWYAELSPGPEEYFIHEKEWPEIEPDVMESNEYRGSAIIVADNVSPAIDSAVLRQWLLMGLDDDNPEFVAATMGSEEARKELVKVEQVLELLPTMVIHAETGEEEGNLRRQRGAALNKKKADLTAKLAAFNRRLDHFRELRESPIHSPFGIYLIDKKPPLGLKTWEIRPRGDAMSARLAYIATHKYNWTEFRVAVHKFGIEKPKVTKGTWKEPLPATFQEINMRGVTIARRRHGKGMFRYGDGGGVFSGQWFNNMRHGVGTHIDATGKLMGSFYRDWKVKKGVQVYSHGDTYSGDWGNEVNHPRPSMIYGKEYNDGLHHGTGKLNFVDGSVYEGEFVSGVPSGPGKYTSATGEVIEGTFGDYGTIEGRGSIRENEASYMGSFNSGLLEGRGLKIDTYAGRYSGFLKMGLPHGFGEADVPVIDGRFEGFHSFGMRRDFGVLNFGNVNKEAMAGKGTNEKSSGFSGSMIRPSNYILLPSPCVEKPYTVVGSRQGMATKSRAEMKWMKQKKQEAQEDGDNKPDFIENTAPGANVAESGDVSSSSSDVWELSDSSTSSSDGNVAAKEQNAANAMDELDKLLDVQQFVDRLTGLKDRRKRRAEKKRRNRNHNKYGTYDQYDTCNLPYLGDYMYEGDWRAGRSRNAGVFTFRRGKPAPHAHNRYYAHHKKNVHLPGLSELQEREGNLLLGRNQSKASEHRRILNLRKQQEKGNLRSYSYWQKVARDNIPKVQEENRRRHRGVEMLKESLLGEQAQEKWEEMADINRFVEPFDEEKHGPTADIDVDDMLDAGNDDEVDAEGYTNLLRNQTGEFDENEELGNDL